MSTVSARAEPGAPPPRLSRRDAHMLANRLTACAALAGCAGDRVMRLYDHQMPRGGQPAAMLHLAQAHLHRAAALLRPKTGETMAWTTVVVASAVAAQAVPEGWQGLAALAALIGCAATVKRLLGWGGRRELRRLRPLPNAYRAAGGLDELRHCFDTIVADVAVACGALDLVRAALPAPVRVADDWRELMAQLDEAAQLDRRADQLRQATALLHDAIVLLGEAAQRLTSHRRLIFPPDLKEQSG